MAVGVTVRKLLYLISTTAKVHSCQALRLQGQLWKGSWWRLQYSPRLTLSLWSFSLTPLLNGASSLSSVDITVARTAQCFLLKLMFLGSSWPVAWLGRMSGMITAKCGLRGFIFIFFFILTTLRILLGIYYSVTLLKLVDFLLFFLLCTCGE